MNDAPTSPADPPADHAPLDNNGPLEGDGLDLAVHYPTPRAAVLTVTGELDTLTSARFGQRAATLLAERPDLIIDLSQVQFLGSSALQVLIGTNDTATTGHGQLHIVTGEQRIVLRAITITALDRVLRLHPDLDTALAALPTP